MNPHNPLAEIFTPKEMIAFLEFAKRYWGLPHDYLTLWPNTCIPPGLQCCDSFKHISKAWQTVPSMNSLFYSQELCPVCGISSALNEVLLPLLTISILSRAAMCQGVSCIVSCFFLKKWSCQSISLHRHFQALSGCNHIPQCFYTNVGRSRNHFTVMLLLFCHEQSAI